METIDNQYLIICQCSQLDPFADDYQHWSPYHFGFNSPLFYNDPLGLEATDPPTPDELETVVMLGNRRNLWTYTDWSIFVDANKHQDKLEADLIKEIQNFLGL